MPASDFYDVDELGQLAVNLFYGWGYNFYRLENQLRADDRLVRERACALLGEARASLALSEAAFRREAIPAPSRAKPFPDAAVLAQAQALEALGRSISGLEAQIRAQPLPESDRVTELYRREDDLLRQLATCDRRLVGQAELLRRRLDGADAEAVRAMRGALEEGLRAISETLRDRRRALDGV